MSDEIGYNLYSFTDSRNNSVFSSSFNMAKRLFHKTMVLMDVELDQTTLPPVEGVTGASRPQIRENEPYTKNRGQLVVGLEQGIGQNFTINSTYYNSQEPDYSSNSFAGSMTLELFNDNLTLGVGGQYNSDYVGKINNDQTYQSWFKETKRVSLQTGHVLSKTTTLNFFGDYYELRGKLDNPYRNENHPDSRFRFAGSAELKQFIPAVEAALVLKYRRYEDNWEINSNTTSFSLNKYITRNTAFETGYRFYDQSAAYFWKPAYLGGETYYTADYKMAAFTSQNFTLGFIWFMRGLVESKPDWRFLEGTNLKIHVHRYLNTNNFSSTIVNSQIAVEF